MWVGFPIKSMSDTSGPPPRSGGTNPGTMVRPEPAPGLLCRLASTVPRSLAAALLVGLSVFAQSPGIPVNPAPGLDHSQSNSRFPNQPSLDTPGTPGTPEMQARRIKALNQLRHKAMVDDAGKLLLLARELNDDSGNLSSAERLRKAAEIEKLAKSVKDKMSYSVGNDPVAPVYTITSP